MGDAMSNTASSGQEHLEDWNLSAQSLSSFSVQRKVFYMAVGPQGSKGRSCKASAGLESGTPAVSLVLKSKGQSKAKAGPGSREERQRHDNLPLICLSIL